MLIAGGEGTLVGPVFGVALLTLLPTVFQPFAYYKTFAEGAAAGGLLPVAARRHVRHQRHLGRRLVRRWSGRDAVALVPGSAAAMTEAALEVDRPQPQLRRRCAPATTSPSPCRTAASRAVIGPNGAGKTTVFNLVTNLYAADEGEVRFYGTPILGLAARRDRRAWASSAPSSRRGYIPA